MPRFSHEGTSESQNQNLVYADKLRVCPDRDLYFAGCISDNGSLFCPLLLMLIYGTISEDKTMGKSFVEVASYGPIAFCSFLIFHFIGLIFCTLVPRKTKAKIPIDVSIVSFISFMCIFFQMFLTAFTNTLKGGFSTSAMELGMITLLSLLLIYILVLVHFVFWGLFFNNLARTFSDTQGMYLARS